MRKLLLGTAAVALGMSFVASPANAQVKLDIGGHFKGYMSWLDQDETGDDVNTGVVAGLPVDESLDVRSFDMQRDTEIQFSGETTLDNGLTVGFHTEVHADGTDSAVADGTAGLAGDSFNVEESYAYFSGAWGRVNFGAEDGATYLLQIAAPSADSNVDGIRTYINPINHASLTNPGSFAGGVTAYDDVTIRDLFGGAVAAPVAGQTILDGGAVGASAGDIALGAAGVAIAAVTTVSRRLDYDHAVSAFENKLTYMTPVFNGFQGGLSYTPEFAGGAGAGLNNAVGIGSSLDDTIGDYGDIWELAARYEGQFDEVGVAIGGGWSHTDLEQDRPAGVGAALGNNAVFFNNVDGSVVGGVATFTAGDVVIATLDDREAWNVGVDFDWKAFGLGGGYTEDDNGVSNDKLQTETWFVGLDYTTGPFKLGASYIDQNQNFGGADLDQDRWTAGVVYTYGPGMTFRGSINFTDFDENLGNRTATTSANGSADATSVLLGTQINF